MGAGRPGITRHGSAPEAQGHHSKPMAAWQLPGIPGFMVDGRGRLGTRDGADVLAR
jgi:hypothetical protein